MEPDEGFTKGNLMELKVYLRILRRKWWIALPVFVFTFVPVLIYTINQPNIYEAKATYVAKLSASLEGDNRNLASALDILSRRVEIATTYAEVANSTLIKDLATREAGLSVSERSGMSVNSRVIAGTNVIVISVQGTDPELVKEFTNAVGKSTQSYVHGLYETYELALLDQAVTPKTPIRPQRSLYLGLGGIFGLALGLAAVFLSEYLQQSSLLEGFNIVDGESGAYNERYFQMRLHEELTRSRRNNTCLSVVLMEVNPQGELNGKSRNTKREALRRVVAISRLHLRDEDIVARVGDTLFALLLPDLKDEDTKNIIEVLRTKIAMAPFEIGINGIKLQLNSAAGITDFREESVGREELLIQASRALKDAATGVNGRVTVFSEIAGVQLTNGKGKGKGRNP
ncbi:MAG: diguanylate cyclase [Candidatus Methanosuratincola sp.]